MWLQSTTPSLLLRDMLAGCMLKIQELQTYFASETNIRRSPLELTCCHNSVSEIQNIDSSHVSAINLLKNFNKQLHLFESVFPTTKKSDSKGKLFPLQFISFSIIVSELDLTLYDIINIAFWIKVMVLILEDI